MTQLSTLNHQKAVDYIQHHARPLEKSLYTLLCYIRLAETANLPDDIRQRLVTFLTPIMKQAVPRDPAQWGDYGLTPLTVVSTPKSLFYAEFADVIPQNLAYIFSHQADEGYWSPSWSWAFAHADGWRDAEQDLRGIFTLNNLLFERHFA